MHSDFMPGPKVRFQIDEKKDIKTFFCFSDDTEYDGGRSLNWSILDKYQELKAMNKKLDFKNQRDYCCYNYLNTASSEIV